MISVSGGNRRQASQPAVRALIAIVTSFTAILLFLTVFNGGNNMASYSWLRSSAIPSTLVMVPGHGIFVKDHWEIAEWLKRFIPDIEQQIREALEESSKDAVVMFSGGQTHRDVGRISEGASYITAAKHLGITNANKGEAEEFARDSFENVLFSICRFRQITGAYPKKFIVVGFEFKRERFENEHRAAIRFPVERFEYRGIPKPNGSIQEQIDLERKGTIPQFQADPYGCKPPLSTKKDERNPFSRHHYYEAGCPEIAGLFRACGPHVYQGPLPW